MVRADKTRLLTPRLDTEDHEIPEIGTIVVRGLSREEAAWVSMAKNTSDREIRILRHGVKDPAFSTEEVKTWMKCAPAGELEKVIRRISKLSGMEAGSDTERYKSDGEQSGD